MFIDREFVFFGDIVDVEIKIIVVDYFVNKFIEKMEFEFREGVNLIGRGVIKYLVNIMFKKFM